MASAFHEQVLANLPDGITIQDKDFNIIYQNQAMIRAFGDHVGEKCYAVYERREGVCESCGLQKAFETGKPNMVLRTAFGVDGTTSYWENSCFPLFDDAGNIVAGVEVCRNITDRVSLEEDVKDRNIELGQLNKQLNRKTEELQKARNEAERLLASMPSFLIELDALQQVIRWNPAAEALFGTPAESVVGQKLNARCIQWDWQTIAKDVPQWPLSETTIRWPEIRYRQVNGKDGFLSVSLNPIRNEAGEVQGCFLLGTDLTERLELERRLSHAQKLEAIGRLAAGIAHEINTPTQYVGDNIEFVSMAYENLTKIVQTILKVLEAGLQGAITPELLAEAKQSLGDGDLEYLTEQTPRALEQAHEGIDRIAAIVRAMKEFSHPSTAQKTLTDLNQCIQNTVTVSRGEWKNTADIVLKLANDLPKVFCLPGEFNQALLNMIVNAVDAIDDARGENSGSKGTIAISSSVNGNWVEIQVSDDGAGIPEDARDHIFEPFFTTKEVGRGTGQGLAIAYDVIVDKHGGSISVESEAGKGTTLTIRLPATSSGSG